MPNDKPKTNISSVNAAEIRLKGYKIDELMGRKSFAEIVYLILYGELPTVEQLKSFRRKIVSEMRVPTQVIKMTPPTRTGGSRKSS